MPYLLWNMVFKTHPRDFIEQGESVAKVSVAGLYTVCFDVAEMPWSALHGPILWGTVRSCLFQFRAGPASTSQSESV